MDRRPERVEAHPERGFDAAFLAQVLDLVAHPIFVKDRAYRFVLVNRALCELVGQPCGSIVGKTDYDFFPKEEADWFRRKDEELFASGASVGIDEEPITDASGERHVLATTKVPLRGPDGTVSHIVGIIHDITRLKRAEEALRQSNEELERRVRERTAALVAAQEELVRKERLATLGQLAGGLAHQIRNPLASITNAAEILKRLAAHAGQTELVSPIEMILEEAWKANSTITGLLEYVRARPPQPRAIDLARIIERALAGVPVPNDVRVALHLPEDLPPVAVDAEQVREALENLVRNALEAMPRGGELTLAAYADGAEVVLFVEDTGPGIPESISALLFQPLVTTKPHGLGLGLTTARRLVENQRGTLRLAGGSGAGARFELRLPAHPPM